MSFSDHTHALTALTGILGVTNGGTGVNSMDDLKIALGVSSINFNITKVSTGGDWSYVTVPSDWICYIGLGNRFNWGYKTYSTSRGTYTRAYVIDSSSSGVVKFDGSNTDYHDSKISCNDNYISYLLTFYV